MIDECIAFMGGIDACFGRWDTSQHILVDDPELNGGEKIWLGEISGRTRQESVTENLQGRTIVIPEYWTSIR